jgi:hypothetical protein
MSFDVLLLPSTRSPQTAEAFRAGLEGALRAMGARGDMGSVIDFPNGGSVEIFAGGERTSGEGASEDRPGAMLAFRGFGLSHAEAVFRLADATASFIHAIGADGTFTTPSTGEAPDEYPEPCIAVADPAALLAEVEGGFDAWADYRDQVVGSYRPSFLSRLWSRLTGRDA